VQAVAVDDPWNINVARVVDGALNNQLLANPGGGS
jgi:hypothetical protein